MLGIVKRYGILFVLLCWPLFRATAQATPVFDFNPQCQQAYARIIQLRMKEAATLIAREKQAHPGNLIPYFLDNYIATFRLLFNGAPSDYQQYLKQSEERVSRVKTGPSDSPYYLYLQSVMNLQTAACKYKFGDRVSSFWNVRRSYLQILSNQKKHPDFDPNKIVLGPMKALVGSIPSNYRWATRLLGFKDGSVNEGLRLMQSFLDAPRPQGAFFKQEAVFYYAYMVFYLKHEPDAAIAVVQEHHLDLRTNALYAFMTANLYLNDHAADKALTILQQRQTSPAYMDIPVMHYELATAYLYHLELDRAIAEFKRFLEGYNGRLYAKDALYKISWAYYLKGDRPSAEKYRKLVLSEGSEVADADKVAVREVQAGEWPDPVILQARLLFTGGYFNEALDKIRSREVADYAQLEDKVEYTYFLARIRDEMGQDDQALLLYEAAIKGGKQLPQYFAARAALQMGFIYEQRGEKQQAIHYFNACLNMPNEEYKETLDQRAKSGISRLSSR